MANTVYITAGLPVAKDDGQSPGAGVNTVYITAGLPPVVEEAAAAGFARPKVSGSLAHGRSGLAG